MNAPFVFTIQTQKDLIEAVQSFGFLPLFRNSLPGFSVEEHVLPRAWFSAEPGVWEWKGPVIQKTRCAYGKFFEKEAAFVSAEWFPDLANYRRDGYDFDARYDDGLASYGDKRLYDLVDSSGPILSRQLKKLGDYRKGGRKGFDTAMNRLQSQCYIVTSNFVYLTDKYGREYGWGVVEYSTPEQIMGASFTERVYQRKPEDSYQRIAEHIKMLLPQVEEDAAIRKFMK